MIAWTKPMNSLKPSRFGKYIFLEKIGTGGMAELYKAKIIGIQGFEKLIAIKKILPHLVDEKEFVDCFIDEAKLAALLNHQNIVQIYDFGSLEGTYYIAMQYLKGQDLRMIRKRAEENQVAFGLEYILYIVSRICSGLDYAHKLKDFQGKPLNLIHRDISPQNIFITYDGDIKILDFGIAKAAARSSKTQAGMIKGKVAYMAPEQASGEQIDYRSDIFSTGIIFYELVTGHRMFTGDTMEILSKVREAAFIPPEDIARDLPEQIYSILHKALSKKPENRYASCADMLADLEECIYRLSKWPTSRGLSQLMHTLFPQEIAADEKPLQETDDSVDHFHSGTQQSIHFDSKHLAADETGQQEVQNHQLQKSRKKMIVTLTGLTISAGIIFFLFFQNVIDRSPHQKQTEPAPSHTQAQKMDATQTDSQLSSGTELPGGIKDSIPGQEPQQAEANRPQPDSNAAQSQDLLVLKEKSPDRADTASFPGRQAPLYSPASHAFDVYRNDAPGGPRSVEMQELPDPAIQAITALEKADFKQAVQRFNAALAEDPSILDRITKPFVRALRERSQELIETEPEEAHTLLLQATQLAPGDSRSHFMLGQLYVFQENYADAINAYEKVIELDPGFADAYFNLGYISARTKDYAKAEEMYKSTVKLQPSYLDEAFSNLAIVQYFRNDFKESKRNLEKALQINPENDLAQKYLEKIEKKSEG